MFERLCEAVDELTLPRVTLESVPYWSASRHRKFRLHRVTHQPLLVELAGAVVPGGGMHEEGAGWSKPQPGSRPTARLEAIDALAAISAGVRAWLGWLELVSRGAIAADLRQIVGVAGSAGEPLLRNVAVDACGWATLARVVTGWESPAYAPHVACPACDRVGYLRVRLVEQVGVCLLCRADWRDATEMAVLVAHIRVAG